VPGQQAAPAAVTAEPALKLSVVIDPALEAVLVRLPPSDIRTLYTRYVATHGGEPNEDIEPTIEQISAMAQVVSANMPPYADVSLFGPHGHRLLSKLTYQAWSFQFSGTWQRRELPGPPTFELWWSSFRVLRVVYLLLEIFDAQTIEGYWEFVRTFTQTYGGAAWFIVYNADIRMRAEQWERLRKTAEQAYEAAQSPLGFRRSLTLPSHGKPRSGQRWRTATAGTKTCTGPPSCSSPGFALLPMPSPTTQPSPPWRVRDPHRHGRGVASRRWSAVKVQGTQRQGFEAAGQGRWRWWSTLHCYKAGQRNLPGFPDRRLHQDLPVLLGLARLRMVPPHGAHPRCLPS